MKKLGFFTVLAVCFVLPMTMGCGGGGETTVIEAPPEAVEEEPAIEGMTDEEYEAAMNAEISGQ